MKIDDFEIEPTGMSSASVTIQISNVKNMTKLAGLGNLIKADLEDNKLDFEEIIGLFLYARKL